MKDNSSLAHSKWNCKYHIVFAPKYRRMLIYGKLKKEIGEIFRMLCTRKGIETLEAEWYNREVSKIRIAIEHVNAFLKKFKIISTRFRNRRKNFKLYMSLICGIYNFEVVNR